MWSAADNQSQSLSCHYVVFIERLRFLGFLKTLFLKKLRNPGNSFFEISFPMKTRNIIRLRRILHEDCIIRLRTTFNRYLTFLRTFRYASTNLIAAVILRFIASRSCSFSLTILIPTSRDIRSWSEAAEYTRRVRIHRDTNH